jgi:exonuclease SbcC
VTTLYENLQEILVRLLADERPAIQPTPSGSQPVFLQLKLRSTVAVFATLKSGAPSDAEAALQSFKDLYTLNSRHWSDCDLNLVLCQDLPDAFDEDFAYRVENDPFFCRKFVLDPRSDLRDEIGRLPFLPLRPAVVGIQRPVEAKAFLMGLGINRALATGLIAYGRSPEAIVSSCRGGEFGVTGNLMDVPDTRLAPEEGTPKRVGLRSLEITNFRAYRKPQTFDLGARLVVLYGPNGLGKTSFFDAIDFLCTGGVARLDDKFVRTQHPQRLVNALRHLDAGDEDSIVSAEVERGEEKIALRRSVDDRTRADVGGKSLDAKGALQFLAGMPESSVVPIRVDTLRNLFRASHLFGQEFQSLTQQFEDGSSLNEDTVSRMLALQDYVDVKNKLQRTSDLLEKMVIEARQTVSELCAKREPLREQLDKLRKMAQENKHSEPVAEVWRELASEVARLPGMSGPVADEPDLRQARYWHEVLESGSRGMEQSLRELTRLESTWPEVEQRRAALETLRSRRSALVSELDRADKDCRDLEAAAGTLKAQTEALVQEQRHKTERRDALAWLSRQREQHGKLLAKLEMAQQQKVHILTRLEQIDAEMSDLNATIDRVDRVRKTLTDEVERMRRRARMLRDLETAAEGWGERNQEETLLRSEVERISNEIPDAEEKVRKGKAALEAARLRHAEVLARFQSVQEGQNERQTLLAQLERHISNGICPVCGTVHESREALLGRMRESGGARSADSLALQTSLEKAEAARLEAAERVKALMLVLERARARKTSLEGDLAARASVTREIVSDAADLGIHAAQAEFEATIARYQSDCARAIDASSQELTIANAEFESAKSKLSALSTTHSELASALRAQEEIERKTQGELSQLEATASARAVSFRQDPAATMREVEENANALQQLDLSLGTRLGETEKSGEALAAATARRKALQDQVATVDLEFHEASKFLARIGVETLRFELGTAADRGALVQLAEQLRSRISQARSLASRSADIEKVLVSLEASTEAEELHHRIETECEVPISRAKSELGMLESWTSYFSRVMNKVESQQNLATKEYIESYGPMTWNIQRRLRSVYGFGRVYLVPTGGRIDVRVERKAEHSLAPDVYFSQSQLRSSCLVSS